MAFGNYTPMGGYYPQNFYGPVNNAAPDMLSAYKTPYQPQTIQPASNPFLWVESEDAAKAYLVAPGNTVVLWDSKKPFIYVRSADGAGIPSTKIYEYKEYADSPTKPTERACTCGDKFVTKEDFAALQGEVERLTKRIEATTKQKSKIVKQLEEDDDEQFAF